MTSRNVQVCVRSRPLSKKEKDQKLSKQWQCNGNTILNVDPTTSYDSFTFDHIFDENDSTQNLFETIAKPIIAKALKGINGTIFAYGQTSSGKTHTMTGCDGEAGVIGLAVKEIFELIEATTDRQFLLRVAYIEIYNEKIYDLFTNQNDDLKVHEKDGDVYVHSKEYICKTAELILDRFEEGSKKRRTGETNMNERSSRSHSIFRITIESREIGHTDEDSTVQISNLNLVDLAGSERADQTGASGYRLKEGSHINRSLLSLSRVIQKLSEPETDTSTFINYRDSKLTRVLQAALGGNALTVIICTVTPAVGDETYYTLCFAMRAKSVRNRPKVNEVVSDKTMTKRLEKEIERLRDQLKEEKNKNSEIAVQKLMSQISERETQFIQSHATILKAEDKSRRRTWCPSSNTLPPIFESRFSDDPSEMMPPPPPFIRPNSEFINLQGREVRSTTPTLFSLDDSGEFRSSVEFLLMERETQQSPTATPHRMRVEYTPEILRNRRCSVDTPTGETLRYKYKQATNDLKELEEFTKLEERAQVDHIHCAELLSEFNRTRIVTADLLNSYQKVQNELIYREVSLEAAEARVKTLEDRLIAADLARAEQEKIEKLEAEIATLQKALLTQTKLTETAEILKNSVDYEFEEFKKRLKNREVELTICLDRERDLNATFAEKIRSAEARAMDADEAKEKLHQIMRADALESAEQITRLSAEVEAVTRRMQGLEKEVADAEADRAKVATIDSIILNLGYARRTKHGETKSAIQAIKNVIRPTESGSLDDSNCMDTSLVVDDQSTGRIVALEKSLAEQKAQIDALAEEKKSLDEKCTTLQQEYDNLSMQAMEQIEENDKLQAIITSVGKIVAHDSTLPLDKRVAQCLEELNAKITSLQTEAKKEEKQLQTSLIIEDDQMQELVKTNEDLNVAVRRMGQEINTLNEQQMTADGVTKELAELRSDHAALQNHLEGIKSTVTWLEQEKAQLELVVEQYKREATEAVEEISSLKSSLKDLERSEIANESSTLATEELTNELEAARSNLATIEAAKIDGERKIQELQTKLTTEATTAEQLRLLNEQTIQELEEKITTMEMEFGEKVNAMQSQIEEQEAMISQKDLAALTLKERVTDLENNMNMIRQEASQRENFAERCGQMAVELETLKNGNRDYCSLIGQLEVEKQILADTMAKEGQQYEEKLKSSHKEMKHLTAQLAAKTHDDSLQDQLLTLQIDNTNLQSRVLISEDRAIQAQLESSELRDKLAQNTANIEQMQGRCTETAVLVNELTTKLNALTEENRVLVAKLSEQLTHHTENEALILQLEELKLTASEQNKKMQAAEKVCDNLKAENEKLQSLDSELAKTIASLDSKIQETEKAKNDRDAEILLMKQEIDTKARTVTECERMCEKLTVHARELENEKSSRLAELSALQNRLEAMAAENKMLQEDYGQAKLTASNFEEVRQQLTEAEKAADQLRRTNVDLKRAHAFKIDQLQQQIDAANEPQLQLSGVSNRCLQLEKVLKSTCTELEQAQREATAQTAEVQRLTKHVATLQARNEKYMLDLDEAKRDLELDDMRSSTKRLQKSRRQSSHDEKRRQSMWDHRDKAIQTEPTDVNCNCEAMSQQIKEMRKDLFVKNAQLGAFKKMAAINPLQNDYDEMKKALMREEKEKNALIEEKNCLNQRLHEAILKKDNSSTATQTDAITSSPTVTIDSGVVLKMENKQLTDDLTRLQKKYEDMKRLCRMRKEEISSLKEVTLNNREKENESTQSNGGASRTSSAETENIALKKLVGEWEDKYSQLKQLYYTKHTKFTSKASRTDQNVQTDATMAELTQLEASATKYKYAKKLCEWRKAEIAELEKKLTQAGVAYQSRN